MKELLESLILDAIKKQVSDIHFQLDTKLCIFFREMNGIKEIKKLYDESIFEYLKYISNLDISGSFSSQSGAFHLEILGKIYYFRFSYIQHLSRQSGVLRILNNHPTLQLKDLSQEKEVIKIFKSWCKKRVGFIIFSGPTGSGKTTTLHVLLEEIAKNNKLKIITLEDPIEIYSNSYLQMQINEKVNFTYQEGIKHLLRQDPDVIMIGEIRDEITAKMAFRAALSGHMVFTTIHAKTASEALKRFVEFGIDKDEIYSTLTGVVNQRLFKRKNKKEKLVIYEILNEQDIKNALQGIKPQFDISDKIRSYYDKKEITKEDAQKEIEL